MESRSDCCSWCNQRIPEEQLEEVRAKEDAFRAAKAKHTAELAALNKLLHDMKRRLEAAGPKRIGRPTKTAAPGERFQIGVRVTPEMKARLDAAAIKSTRSLSQEAEFRLERSFDREDLLPEVLRITFGKQTAGLLMMLGYVMNSAGYTQSGHTGAALGEAALGSHWTDDATAYEAATGAASYLLQAARPDGEIANAGYGEALRTSAAVKLLLCKQPAEDEPEAWRCIRSFLGPMAERISESKGDEDQNNKRVRRAQGGKP